MSYRQRLRQISREIDDVVAWPDYPPASPIEKGAFKILASESKLKSIGKTLRETPALTRARIGAALMANDRNKQAPARTTTRVALARDVGGFATTGVDNPLELLLLAAAASK